MKSIITTLAVAGPLLLGLPGCGGGGSGSASDSASNASPSASSSSSGSSSGSSLGSSGGAAAASTLTGTAAIGAPIQGNVVAIDINGKVSPAASTAADGAFTVDVSGMTAPFMLSITGSAAGKQVTLNSVATAAGQTVNLTPLTDLIVASAAGRPAGSSLAALCAPVANVVAPACLSALSDAANATRLTAAVTAVSDMIKPINSSGLNPLTGSFKADGSGMDAVLDQILVAPATALGAQATVTLIATNTALGQVTLPGSAGGSASHATTAPSAPQLAAAGAAASVLPEIKACLASFNALYTGKNGTPPSVSRVGDFFDAGFRLGKLDDKAALTTFLSSAQVPAGLAIQVAGLSPIDMTPLSATELQTLQANASLLPIDVFKARTTSAVTLANGAPVSAWVQIGIAGDASSNNWKMVKGAAYPGCAGGWRFAGSQHVDMHMMARIARSQAPNGTVSYSRQWAFHLEKEALADEGLGVDTVLVRGPGLSTYSGNPASPVGSTGVRLTLTVPAPGDLSSTLLIDGGNGFYGKGEALQSCQDLTSTSAPAGTPCIDESAAPPGSIYTWSLRSGGVNGTVVGVFAYLTNAVPLSKAFAQANEANLFATITSVTPADLSAYKSASAAFAPGTVMDGLFRFNFTQGSAYGSRSDNCFVNFFDATGTKIFGAEQNPGGSQTSCIFNTASLNSGTLAKPQAIPVSGSIGVSTTVLGNQATSSRAY